MVKAGTVATIAFWVLPVAFLNVWIAGRIVAYFMRDAEWSKADFRQTVLPPDVSAAVEAGFYAVIDKMYAHDLKHVLLRVHIAVSAGMGLICMLLLLPIFARGSKIHRTLGWINAMLLVPFSLEAAYTLFIYGQTFDQPVVILGNVISLVTMDITMPLAIYYARKHRIRAHRACMLLYSAGLYVNPVQRFCWALLAKGNFGAPYASYADWLDKPVQMSEIAAVTACFATALVYIGMGPAKTTRKPKAA